MINHEPVPDIDRDARGQGLMVALRNPKHSAFGVAARLSYKNQPIFRLNVGSGVRPILSSVERTFASLGVMYFSLKS